MPLFIIDVANYLVSEGIIGGSTQWAVWLEHVPPAPDRGIAIFVTPGYEPEIAPEGSSDVIYGRPGIQVRGRSAPRLYQELHGKMQDIHRALHANVNINNCLLIRAVQSAPMNMGIDDNNRLELALNFVAITPMVP